MVYFFSISHLASEDLQEVISALRKSRCPGVSAAAAWYLERGGPWRVRFIYGAHYTVDLFAVSNPAWPAFLELTSTVGWDAGSTPIAPQRAWFVQRLSRVWCHPAGSGVGGQPSPQQTPLAWQLQGQGSLLDEKSGVNTCLGT